MKKALLLVLIVIIVIFSFFLPSCQPSGVPQAQYNQLVTQINDIQAKLAQAQNDLAKAQADKAAVDAQLKNAQSQIASLQGQVSQSSLTGATPAETAAKIVKNYHDTHVYSAYDLFVCSDMASEVWNMLKAQNIGAIVVVGDKDTAIADILQSNHAWVLASVGEWLALETTGGYAVKKSENPLYYRGWSFNSPADLKSHNDMVKEYNVRVGFRNQINSEVNKVAALHNSATSQAEADKYKAVYDKLVELRTAQETELNNLMNNIKKLATVLS
jgi:outer membrane murein-binding lipoprotein Lpp